MKKKRTARIKKTSPLAPLTPLALTRARTHNTPGTLTEGEPSPLAPARARTSHSFASTPLFVLFLSFTALLSACGEEPVARLSAKIVVDLKLMTFVEVFQVFAIKPQTKDGKSVTCSDFPSPFHIGDSSLQKCFGDDQLELQPGCQAQIAWTGATSAAKLQLKVPTNERLLIIAKGLANTQNGPFTVARGCQENLVFREGPGAPVTIDVRATVGRPCFDDNDCETMTTCNNTDPDLPGGYCSKWPCNADIDCPPGSVCLLDSKTNGLCARACDTVADCKDTGKGGAIYGCERRLGTSGCRSACVWSTWNKGNGCP